MADVMTLLDEYRQYNYAKLRNWAQKLDINKMKLFDLVNDIKSRQGLGNELELIDDDIKEQILNSWLSIIER